MERPRVFPGRAELLDPLKTAVLVDDLALLNSVVGRVDRVSVRAGQHPLEAEHAPVSPVGRDFGLELP